MQYPTKHLLTLFIIGLVFVAAAGAVLALTTQQLGGIKFAVSQISTEKQTTFDVTGESNITTIPDQAEVRLGIQVNEPTVAAAQDQANQVINAINQSLGELGIAKEDIKTENYSLYPNYDFQSGSQRITGYSVNANLVVTLTDFTKLNQAIDAATGVGANQIGGITFSLSDDKRAEVEKEARQEAIANAKDKANELAGLAGMRLGNIVNVYESPTPQQPPIFMERAMAADAVGSGGGAPTNVEPGSTTFNYTITLSYETL